MLAGCGHSEDEWQAAQRDIAKLKADLDAANKRHADDEQKYSGRAAADRRPEGEAQGSRASVCEVGGGEGEATQAMAEYEARLKQLDDMKARFRDLKSRLDKLTGAGLNVLIRHNKMVIQLPGDVLFDSGKDSLKPEGKKILKQVADIIKADATLSQRDFQVAGHTDKEPYAGQFIDNWGLSLMRARTVLTFLVAPDQWRGRARRPDGRRARSRSLRRRRLRPDGSGGREPRARRRAKRSRRTAASSSCSSQTSRRC